MDIKEVFIHWFTIFFIKCLLLTGEVINSKKEKQFTITNAFKQFQFDQISRKDISQTKYGQIEVVSFKIDQLKHG